MKKKYALTVWICLTTSVWAANSDWPQYLGPDRNAVAPVSELARSWPEGGPKTLWSVDVGEGYGGAIVKDGKAYFMDRIDSKEDRLRCVNMADGKELWNFGYDAPGKLSFPGSRSIPAIDGNRIFFCGAHGDFYCIDIQNGQPVWNKNIWKEFGGEREPMWGITQNPLIYGDTVIVAAQTPQTGLIAFDKKTGEVVWASPKLPGEPGYVSPSLVQIDGQDHLVMISAGGGGRGRGGRRRGGEASPAEANPPATETVLGMDPKTGKTLWTYAGWQCRIPAPPVTAIGDGRLFISGGYDAGSAMIRIEKTEEGFEAKELFKTQAFGTHVHPPVLYKDHLYAHCSDNSRADGMACMDLDGNLKWKTGRDPQFDKGGFVFTGDLSLHIDGPKGILFLVEPNPEGFKPLAQAQVLDGRSWAPLAFSDGKLIVRDQKTMKCLDLK